MTTSTARSSRAPVERIRAYAALVRAPNLWTAPPDVVAGAALATLVGGPVAPAALGGAVLASVALYAGGTALNDAFDAPVDARERPERPIPSGRVGRTAAFGLGAACLLAGVAIALLAVGRLAGATAGVLAAVVVSYDAALKGRAVGALAMGTARGLNVLLGAAAVGLAPAAAPRALLTAAVVAGYVASVTWMATTETGDTPRRSVRIAGAGALLAGAGVVTVHWLASPPRLAVLAGGALASAALVRVGRALRAAHARPRPEVVGPAVGSCVLALPLFAGAFAASAGVGWAALAAWWLLPATLLARAFDVS